MPSRLFTWAIVTFWLAMTGWLFYREFLPRFQTGKPPRWQPGFVDEVKPTTTHWTIYRIKGPIGSPEGEDREELGSQNRTWLRLLKDRTFEFGADFNFDKGLVLWKPPEIRIVNFKSSYRVGPAGGLRGLGTSFQILVRLGRRSEEITITAQGKVERGEFHSVLKVKALKGKFTLPLDPVKVSPDDSFFDPMQPLTKGPRLRVGQRWRLHTMNVLGKTLMSSLARRVPALGALLPLVKTRMIEDLDAQVSEGTLNWGGRDQDCWVIDYRRPGEDRVLARTWVNKKNRLVLRQEAELMNGRLIMVRGPDQL